MANKTRYKMVRIKEETHSRLLEVVAAIIAKEAKELGITRFSLSDRISLDKAIGILLDRKDSHAERARKSSANRKTKDVDTVDNVDNVPTTLSLPDIQERLLNYSDSAATPQEETQCPQPKTSKRRKSASTPTETL